MLAIQWQNSDHSGYNVKTVEKDAIGYVHRWSDGVELTLSLEGASGSVMTMTAFFPTRSFGSPSSSGKGTISMEGLPCASTGPMSLPKVVSVPEERKRAFSWTLGLNSEMTSLKKSFSLRLPSATDGQHGAIAILLLRSRRARKL